MVGSASLSVVELDLRIDSIDAALGPLVADARVIGVGEGAHFVREFNVARARVVHALVEREGIRHLALEVGFDEAPRIETWLAGSESLDDLLEQVGPLTAALYGTFLGELRDLLGEHARELSVLGVDVPNSLQLTPSLTPLVGLLAEMDPDAVELVEDVRRRSAGITGASAAASSSAWTELSVSDRHAITATLCRLERRAVTLRPLYASRSTEEQADYAVRLAQIATTNVLMLQSMSELFTGAGLTADTSIRERFIADQLQHALDGLASTDRIVYLAHDNHVQKTPISFDGHLAALPAGYFLERSLGAGYAAIAQTHLDSSVPEMDVGAENAIGFTITRAPMEPPADDSLEALVAATETGPWSFVHCSEDVDDRPDAVVQSIRSQSATTAALFRSTFDAALVVRTATDDPIAQRMINRSLPDG